MPSSLRIIEPYTSSWVLLTFKVKEVLLTVDPSNASLNVALTEIVTATPLEPSLGNVLTMIGPDLPSTRVPAVRRCLLSTALLPLYPHYKIVNLSRLNH